MAGNIQNSDESISEINIVPLVDIILVVLIIFMVTVPAVVSNKIDLNLPEAATGEPQEAKSFNVIISIDGRVLINNQEVSEAELQNLASEEINKNADVQAVVTADEGIDYGLVVKTLDVIKSVGIKNLAITTTAMTSE